MSRTTLKPGDIIAVDPVKPGVQAGMAVVSDDGESLYFAFTNKPWHEREDMAKIGQPGLTVSEAEEVLRGEREYTGAVIYKVWEDETQTSYGIPDSVAEEIERRQQASVQPSAQPGETFEKIPPKPLDFDQPYNPSRDGLW